MLAVIGFVVWLDPRTVGGDGSFEPSHYMLARRHWRQAFESSFLSRKTCFQERSVFLFCTLHPIMYMGTKN